MMGVSNMLETTAGAVTRSTDSLIDQLLDAARIHGGAALLARSGMTVRLMRELAECMLAAELDHHLLHRPAQAAAKFGNYRNGSTPKTVSTPSGRIELAVPRVRFSTFVPHLIPRYQRRIPGFDDSILVLLGRGVGILELQSRLLGLYGAHAWADLCGPLTKAVYRHTRDWQVRLLEPACELIYFDALQIQRQSEGQETDTPLFFALAVRADGGKDVLGFWIGSATDDDAFWYDVMCELKDRGLIAAGTIAGDLRGQQEAAALAYPAARFRQLR